MNQIKRALVEDQNKEAIIRDRKKTSMNKKKNKTIAKLRNKQYNFKNEMFNLAVAI